MQNNTQKIKENKKVLLIVESPAKCKTISGYLPKNFEVIATYGHIKSLKKSSGSVLPEKNFKMLWEVSNAARVKEILGKAESISKQDGMIILATDPDREGEAISYHVYSSIKAKVSCVIKRALFNEISKKKIIESINNLTELDQAKIDSYLARIAVDYLIGFNLSPILWKKLKGCKSAGRVQSAVMRAIIERETEIIKFKPQKYWTLSGIFTIDNANYNAELHNWMGKSLQKFMWTSETIKEALERSKNDTFTIAGIEKKELTKAPYPPFTTSTMQQEAASRYGWSPSKTSSVAQALYEGVSVKGKNIGLVTYIRTDSVRIAEDALNECKFVVVQTYGEKYSELKRYSNKSKTSQDSHEAIRPTNFNLLPWELEIDADQKALYELIWRRATASQMSSAMYEVTNIFLQGKDSLWKVHGRIQVFDGFLRVYKQEESKDQILLQSISKSSVIKLVEAKINEHTTQPKPQYTEASLVKHMDEVGIGRPSTYAYTLKTLEAREYIKRENKKIVPTKKGWAVNGFLDEYCPEYIRDNFTANVESELDSIASGEKSWIEFASEFWLEFSKVINQVNLVDAKIAFEVISNKYSYYFFGEESICPKCGDGRKMLCMLASGEFISCSNYPKCDWREGDNDHIIIGQDPETGNDILLKKGQHGLYLNWKDENKNIAIPEKLLESIDLESALKLKKMPLTIGLHPVTTEEIKLNIGRYGLYISHGKTYASCPLSLLNGISLENALNILNRRKPSAKKESTCNLK